MNNLPRPNSITFSTELLTPDEVELDQRAQIQARHYNQSESDLLAIIRDVESSRFFEKLCIPSSVAYCIQILGLSKDVASTFVRVARKTNEIPALEAAIAEGRFGVSFARQILPVLTPQNYAEWIGKASTLTKAELEQEVAKVNPRSAAKNRIRALSAEVHQLEIGISSELRAKIERAQDVCCQADQDYADLERTLEIVVDAFLIAKDPVARAKRLLRRARNKESVRSEMESTCEESAADEAQIRKRTPIPAAVQHEVHARDEGHCQAVAGDGKKCENTRWVDLHHVIAVAEGGRNEATNLTTLCSFHHRLLHRRQARRPGTPAGAKIGGLA